jgi:hypothetical protein
MSNFPPSASLGRDFAAGTGDERFLDFTVPDTVVPLKKEGSIPHIYIINMLYLEIPKSVLKYHILYIHVQNKFNTQKKYFLKRCFGVPFFFESFCDCDGLSPHNHG